MVRASDRHPARARWAAGSEPAAADRAESPAAALCRHRDRRSRHSPGWLRAGLCPPASTSSWLRTRRRTLAEPTGSRCRSLTTEPRATKQRPTEPPATGPATTTKRPEKKRPEKKRPATARRMAASGLAEQATLPVLTSAAQPGFATGRHPRQHEALALMRRPGHCGAGNQAVSTAANLVRGHTTAHPPDRADHVAPVRVRAHATADRRDRIAAAAQRRPMAAVASAPAPATADQPDRNHPAGQDQTRVPATADQPDRNHPAG